MIMQVKRWVQGAGMAALVLTGSAMLDGQRIQSQEEVKIEQPRWYTVRTVMDIDKLPEDAKWVRGENVSGAHLEFLAKRQSVEAVDFSRCEDLRADHIRTLSAMKNLKFLELRGAEWGESPDYSALTSLKALKELAVDYVPRWSAWDLSTANKNWDAGFNVTDSLRDLSARGVLVTLGNLDEISGKTLATIAENVTTLRELNLEGNSQINDADLKVLASHPALERLNLEECYEITELGLAYLAERNRLRSLRVSMEISEPIVYQLGRMTNLERLEVPWGLNLNGGYGDEENYGELLRKALTQLSGLKNLKYLCWYVEQDVRPEDFSPLAKLPALRTLSLRGIDKQEDLYAWLDIAAQVPVTRLEIGYSLGLFEDDKDILDGSLAKELAKHKDVTSVKEILLDTGNYGIFADRPSEAGALPLVLKKFPSLKHVTLLAMDKEESNFYKAYAAKFLGDYEVIVETKPDLN